MKHTISLIIFLLVGICTHANKLDDNPHRALFKVKTYTNEGTVGKTGFGFLINDNTTGIAPYTLFKGATKAEITDYKGNTFLVERILGASSSLDIVKFRIPEIKKATPLISTSTSPETETKALLLNYTTDKKSLPIEIKIEKAEDYLDYKYYYITAQNVEKNFGCPLLTPKGELFAIVQKNLTEKAKSACALDARFAATLSIRPTSSLSNDLLAIKIPKALPQAESDALTYIYMMNDADSTAMLTALDDFISQYPENAEGYVNRAVFLANHGQYEDSEKDFATAISKAEAPTSTMKADAVHYNFSKLLFTHSSSNTTPKPANWNMHRALQEAIAAHDSSPSPLYMLQRGDCEYALSQFAAATESYKQVSQTELASPNIYYKTALAMERAKMPPTQILVQLDSAVAMLQKPYKASEAYYLYVRALQEISLEKYRQAAIDLKDYEQAVGAGSLSHTFFADRSQTERKAKMFQQALDDIKLAQVKAQAPQTYFYKLEEASILLQVAMFDEAIEIAKQLLVEIPENPDCYKIIGIAYGEKKQTKEAIQNLSKAQQLGDTTVEQLIEKYSNR